MTKIGIFNLLTGDKRADRLVSPTGVVARLNSLTAAAMCFLAVFALALSLATQRLAQRWSAELAQTSTVRISAPAQQLSQQAQTVLEILQTTEGIAAARLMSADEQRSLLEPWFGPDLPLENLPIPQLIEVIEAETGPDMAGLRLRLAAQAPGAVLDDHTRWRAPLVDAANRLRLLSISAIALTALVMIAMVILAAKASLAANATEIRVLRLIGATDHYIAKAFVRRLTLRALWGAILGTALGALAILTLPAAAEEGAFLTGLGFQGWHWMLNLLLPIGVAIIAFWSTRITVLRSLNEIG